ncbi:MAG TPA: radical SAM protein [Candidatus Acidoferrum sp.]|jgi:wyosine [tRNA(Phe)-imidazoG37] synthetase (radical SAM superfamily)|nr:radical SAM protein [Candidatus Acidoferrum sp.]
MQNELSQCNGHAPGGAAGPSGVHEPATDQRNTVLTAFGRPRNPLDNQFVYAVISQRAHGLSIGVNLNPDKRCNFGCVYCEVNRDQPGQESKVDIGVMSAELARLLGLVRENKLRDLAWFRHLPPELLALKEVALSGDGEPTLCPNFHEVVREVVYVRSRGMIPFFKIVLITNGTGLDSPDTMRGLGLLAAEDEVWVKLDAGTQEHMEQVNCADVPLWKILGNILLIGRQRPIIIQGLFPLVNGKQPSPDDIEQYVQRLQELKDAGAQIDLVQVYSAHRPPHRPDCEHLPLKALSHIARRVREKTGLKAQVF